MLLSNFRWPCVAYLQWEIHLRGKFHNVSGAKRIQTREEGLVWGWETLPPYTEDWNSLSVDMSGCCRAWSTKVCAGLWCWQQRYLLSKGCVWHQEMFVFLLCKIPSWPQAATSETGNLFLTRLHISEFRAKPWLGGNKNLHDHYNWHRLNSERR